MRFIGNKENLLTKIHQVMQEKSIQGENFFDFFAGTGNVGKYFKKLNYSVQSSDILYFSYVLQRAYIVNNKEVSFDKLLKVVELNSSSLMLFDNPLALVIEYLNNIEPLEGFIYQNYTPTGTKNLQLPRMFFSDNNGKKIDSIRTKIENWYKEKLITDDEYYVLIACLIETVPFYANISGVYAAFHKKWDPRALKPIKLRSIEIIKNDKLNKSFNNDSLNLLNEIETDILYLDPPYNQRQYAPNYHLLETIAKYDNPIIKGVAGLRDYSDQKSAFCNAASALKELDRIASMAKYKTLMLSYNSEGIMKKEDILNILTKYGNVELVEFQYLRFKSNNNGDSKTKKFIFEQLYLLKK